MAANDHAIFQLADSLVKADRYYLITHDLGSQRLHRPGRSSPRCSTVGRIPTIRRRARLTRPHGPSTRPSASTCSASSTLSSRAIRHGSRRWFATPPREGVSSSPYLIHVPRGVAGAEPYRVDSDAPPTPRQIRELMTRLGVEPALELLMRHHEKCPKAPVLPRGDLGFALVDEFLELGRTPTPSRSIGCMSASIRRTSGSISGWAVLREIRLRPGHRVVQEGPVARPGRCRSGRASQEAAGDEDDPPPEVIVG